MIRTVDLTELTAHIAKLLAQWPTLADAGLTVERSEPVNESASRTPWLGVYSQSVDYVSRTLGAGAGYRMQVISFVLLLQAADLNSGAECHAKLTYYVAELTAALLSDTSLGGRVGNITALRVDYNYTAAGNNSFLQTAVIGLEVAAPVSLY